MALYHNGIKVDDFWSDPKNVEAVFKLLAFAAGTAVITRFLGGNAYVFPLPETWRGALAYLMALYLVYLQFRYADAALVEPYMAHRKAKGLPESQLRHWFAALCALALGVLWPIVSIIGALPK